MPRPKRSTEILDNQSDDDFDLLPPPPSRRRINSSISPTDVSIPPIKQIIHKGVHSQESIHKSVHSQESIHKGVHSQESSDVIKRLNDFDEFTPIEEEMKALKEAVIYLGKRVIEMENKTNLGNILEQLVSFVLR